MGEWTLQLFEQFTVGCWYYRRRALPRCGVQRWLGRTSTASSVVPMVPIRWIESAEVEFGGAGSGQASGHASRDC